MTTTALRREIEVVSPTRQRVMGIVFLGLAFAIWFLFGSNVEGGLVTSYGLEPGGVESTLPDWNLPTLGALNLLAIASAFLGGWQLYRGFGSRTNGVLGIVAAFFVWRRKGGRP